MPLLPGCASGIPHGLVEVRHNIGEKNKNLKKQNTRLQPYISEQVFRSAADDIAINGRKRYLTVFFSDIEGFTYLMDHLNEDTITRMLNEYLDEMAQIAHRFGGTVDKFMGDGVMIFFGDQQSRGHREDALCCISMAIEMRLKLYGIAARWRDFGPELHIRIGIHSGFCTVGNFGSAQRMDYTAVAPSGANILILKHFSLVNLLPGSRNTRFCSRSATKTGSISCPISVLHSV